MKNEPDPGDVMRIVCAALLLVFVLCCLDTFIDEVKYCILLNYHFMLLMIIGRRAWQIIITFICNWLMRIVDSMHSFLKEGGEVWDLIWKILLCSFIELDSVKRKKRKAEKRGQSERTGIAVLNKLRWCCNDNCSMSLCIWCRAECIDSP